MSVLRGDFIGFTFNGVHSSDLGIVRVSNGDRYEIDLSPSFTDRTSHIQGSDETYYFGTDCTSKTHRIDIAFDSITEAQLRRIKQVFSPKVIGQLIYDETPYKYYIAKCTTSPNLKYLCFDDEMGRRVYKGEGNIELISYYPYALSRYKFLEDYQVLNSEKNNPYINIPEWQINESNLDEWIESSGIISKYFYDNGVLKEIDEYNRTGDQSIYLYNPGDISVPVDFILSLTSTGSLRLKIDLNNNTIFSLNNGNTFPLKTGDTKIKLKSKEGVIVGLNSNNQETGNLYNEYLSSSTGFYLPVISPTKYTINGGSTTVNVVVEYNYIYY